MTFPWSMVRTSTGRFACRTATLVGAMMGTVWAQLADDHALQTLDRVEVIGSAIARVQREGPAPVTVMDRQAIQRTGARTVNELLRHIPAIDFNDFGEQLSNSPSLSGTTTIAMRGLDASNVLVLLNGRRLPVNAMSDATGAGAAVDVNMIAVSAIERIEVLKDGGSALYGADAIAAVVNIITRRAFQGVALRAGHGQSHENDGKESSAGFSWGWGDLKADRVNVMASLDYLHRTPILRKDRPMSASANFERFGGPDRRSVLAPTGNIIDPTTGALVGVPYKPCPAQDLTNGGTICRYDFNAGVVTAYNGANRLSGMLRGTWQLSPQWQGFGELTYTRAEATFEGHPVPAIFLVPALDAAQGAYRDPSVPITGSNPFGSVYILGRFMQGGLRITRRESSLLNLAVGLEGFAWNMDWKTSLSHGVSRASNSDENYYNATAWANATNTGLIDPTVDTNDPAFVESLKVSPKRMARATLDTLAAQASGELAQWPAGPVQFAAGASVAREQLADTPDPLLQAGQVVGAIAQSAVDAARNNLGVFVELGMPLTAQLESQLALRFDRYGSVSAASPKAALAWRATPHWLMRSSYSRSFRAPGLKQLYGAQEQSAATVTDPVQCQILVGASPCTQAVFQVSGANAGLEPEKASTSNIGTVFEWNEGRAQLDASVDLWRISKDKSIDTPSLDTAIREGLYTQVGPQYFVFTRLFNLAQLVSAGVDVDWRVRWPTLWGRVSVHNTSTYMLTYKKRKPGEDWADYKGTYARPIWRNRFSVSLDRAAWGAQLTVRSVGGFSDSDLPKPHPSGTREVGAYEELDVQLSYAGFGGVRGLTLTGGIKNLMDRQPPFSLQNVTSNSYSQMGFAEIYDNRGRFYYLSASYQF